MTLGSYSFMRFQQGGVFQGRNDRGRFNRQTKFFFPNVVPCLRLGFSTASRNTFHVEAKESLLPAPSTRWKVPRASTPLIDTALAAAGRLLHKQGLIVRDRGGDLISYGENARDNICGLQAIGTSRPRGSFVFKSKSSYRLIRAGE